MSHKKEKRNDLDTKEENYVPKAFRKNMNNNEKIQGVEGKDNKKKTSKKVKKKKGKLKKAIIIIVIFFILIVIMMLGISANNWKKLAKAMLINENSIVIDADGNTIAKLGCEKNNETVDLSDIPNNLKNAYVAIEDERFYSHNGVDVKRTGAAIFSYIFNFGNSSYGGSTITQQLVKNLTGDSTDSITRKVKEWLKAWQLESCLSKDEILGAYLNIIYVGPNIYGVETGSKYYFNKSSKDLSLEECAFLAGINHSPNSYNPFDEKDNEEKIIKRTKIVLSKMLELEYIDEDIYNLAISNVEKGLNFEKGEIKSEDAVYSYHTDALILEITEDIQEKYNISEDFATNYINMAGLTIHSTQDSGIQEKMETEFEKNKYSLSSKKRR